MDQSQLLLVIKSKTPHIYGFVNWKKNMTKTVY
jgi:hypothetical protein